MRKTIMVTGGTGYIGSWVVKALIEKGHIVRVTMRDLKKAEKYKHLKALKGSGKLEFWEANLLQTGSFDEAAKGADVVMHIASPFILRFKDAKKELLDPALLGTKNVLSAASTSGTVKKVILTSSVAAVYGDSIDMKEQKLEAFNETHFNYSSSPSHQTYSYSKLIAEKEAWRIADSQNKWKLVVINPSFVIGPSLTAFSDSESIKLMKDIMKGKFYFGAPDLQFGFVDVRDTAKAHILALENEDVEGRYILAERTMSLFDLTQMMKKIYGSKYRLPFMKAPKFLFVLLAPLFGVTPKFVKRNVNHPLRLDTSRSKMGLGLTYRDMSTSIKDMVDQLEQDNSS